MEPKFITVGKVSSKNDKIIVYPEMIRLDDIKTVRIWAKTREEKEQVKGEMIGIYMKSNESDTPTLRVAESLQNFEQRVSAINMLTNKMKDDSREETKPSTAI